MNSKLALRIGGMLLGAAGLCLVWSQSDAQKRPPLTMEKVAGDVYVIIGNGGNVAVMPTNEGVLLVDDKFEQDAPEITAKVKTLSDKPIRYILNTHLHGDHTGGNATFMSEGAEILAQKNARANMIAQKLPGPPRLTYSDESQVFLGGREVQAKYLGRGHTNGDAMIYFPQEKVLHTGDLFVNGSAPFIDYSSGGSLAEWDKTLQAALDKFDPEKVIPGHGPVATKADLAKWRQTMRTLKQRAQDGCAQGGAEALKQIKLDDLGMKQSPLFQRSYVGICQELARK